MNRFYNTFVIMALAMLPTLAAAQEQAIVNANAVAKADDMIDISFAINGNDCEVGNNETLILRPSIISESGEVYDLEPVFIMGNRRYIINQRRGNPITGNVIRYKDIKDTQYNYHEQVAYKPWMNNASVEIRQDLEGCAGCGKLLSTTHLATIDNIENNFDNKNSVNWVDLVKLAYIVPEVEAVKQRTEQAVSKLDFPVSKSFIKADYLGNPYELAKIQDLLLGLKNEDGVSIKNIEIIGYASPEGNTNFNKKLSEDRALALKSYIQNRCNIPSVDYEVSFGGENWEGLKQAVENTDNIYSSTVVKLINETTDKETLKEEIKRYDGGKLHTLLSREIYPSLRWAMLKVNYNVKNYTDVVEARKVLESKPQNLSLNEMYLVANSYSKGSDEFNDVFEIAVRMFPNDATANLNAAATALSKNDVSKAEKYLNRVKSRSYIPQADNSRGVLYLLKGDKEKALQYFESAAKAGVEEANENIKLLQKYL